MYCEYIIEPGDRAFIAFQVLNLNLEEEDEGTCYDYIEVIEMKTNRSKGIFCDREIPEVISSSGPMKIVFHSDEVLEYPGFLAHYWVSVLKQCLSNGLKAMHAWFRFTDISLEFHSSCNYDYVEIFDGDSLANRSFGKLCGKFFPRRNFQSSGNAMLIRFVTDQSVVETGGFKGVAVATRGKEFFVHNSSCYRLLI
ncbi:unnamed protein product [Soboliphyme baturini]|uniref:CUB domain-containing protein n=1 Tax=Soboliphyme baturini TaxID=241478 RepID=A0A183ISS1_9BILA|nr:unnamed protein product [Soboliphyme baturini]